MVKAKNGEINILMVEDNRADVRLMREAFKYRDRSVRISVVGDGEEAMALLRREGGYRDAPRPDLIILDLNIPKKDGREVLREVKGDPGLRRIPVVVLTTSDYSKDIIMAYDMCANAYIIKPVDLDRFIRIVEAFEDFWLSAVELPPE